jgi:hypothetical protein
MWNTHIFSASCIEYGIMDVLKTTCRLSHRRGLGDPRGRALLLAALPGRKVPYYIASHTTLHTNLHIIR